MVRSIAFSFGDIARLMRKRLDCAARDIGLTGAQWRVLMSVANTPGLNQGQLAERLDVEPITICRMIDRMEQAGLVERRPDPHDRRVRRLYPATHAADLIRQLDGLSRELVQVITHDIDEIEMASLTRALDRIRNRLLDDANFPARESQRG